MPLPTPCNDTGGDNNYVWSDNTELKWCMGWVWLIMSVAFMYRLVLVPFHVFNSALVSSNLPVHFYSCSTQYNFILHFFFVMMMASFTPLNDPLDQL